MSPILQSVTNPIAAFFNDRFRDTSQVGFNSYRLIGEVLYLMWKRLFKSIEIKVQQRLKVKQNVPIIILSSGSQQACGEIIDFLFDSVGGMRQQGLECTFFQCFPKEGIISGNNEFQTSSLKIFVNIK